MLKLAEKIFVVGMLFFTTQAVFPFLTAFFNQGAMGRNPFEFPIQMFFYVGTLFFVAIHRRSFFHSTWSVRWIICLVLVAIASTAWSQDPIFSLRKSLGLVAITVFAIYFGGRFRLSQQLYLLAWTCALVEFCSFATIIFLPKYGVDHFLHPGDWQGAFLQKNLLARFMVISFLVFYFARPPVGRVVRWIGAGGAFLLLVRAHSVTAVVVFFTIMATLPFYKLWRNRVTVAIPATITLAIASIGSFLILSPSLSDLLQLVNRSPDLTGRTNLWAAALTTMLNRPFLGYGFNAFWTGMQGESASVVMTLGWLPVHAHNGFIDVVLDLGLLGLAVFAVGYFALWRRAIHIVRKVSGPLPVWLCTYLMFMFFYNLAESSIFTAAGANCTECSASSSICWVLYVATAVTLYRSSSNPALLETGSGYAS